MSYLATVALLIAGTAGVVTLTMYGIHKYRHSGDNKTGQQHTTPAAE